MASLLIIYDDQQYRQEVVLSSEVVPFHRNGIFVNLLFNLHFKGAAPQKPTSYCPRHCLIFKLGKLFDEAMRGQTQPKQEGLGHLKIEVRHLPAVKVGTTDFHRNITVKRKEPD